MMGKNPNPKVIVNWRATVGEPSSAWRRLWGKLLADRKDKPGGTHQDAEDGGCTSKNGREQK